MDRYGQLREDFYQILENVRMASEALEAYELHPTPSQQMQLDVMLSGLEINMHNTAKSLRERLLV